MAEELTTDSLRLLAGQAGLILSDDELERLRPGINRVRQQAAELRGFLGSNNEFAGAFDASKKAGQ